MGAQAYLDRDVELLYDLLRNYYEIQTFEDAYEQFFSPDYWAKFGAAAVKTGTKNKIITKDAALFAIGPGPGGGTIAVEGSGDNATPVSGRGSYWRHTFTIFKKIGLISCLNPRRFSVYQIPMPTGWSNPFDGDAWKWNKDAYKKIYWNLQENAPSSKSWDKNHPPPVKLEGTTGGYGRVRLVYSDNYDGGDYEAINLHCKDGMYFVSPHILNVIARKGVFLRDIGKEKGNSSLTQRGQSFCDLYYDLMMMLYSLCTMHPDFTANKSKQSDSKNNIGFITPLDGTNSRWTRGNDNSKTGAMLRDGMDNHIYYKAAMFVKDSKTTIAHLDNPRGHPDALTAGKTYMWLDSDMRKKYECEFLFEGGSGRNQGGNGIPGIENYKKATVVFAIWGKLPGGWWLNNSASSLQTWMKKYVDGEPPAGSLAGGGNEVNKIHAKIMAIIKSEIGILDVETTDSVVGMLGPKTSSGYSTKKSVYGTYNMYRKNRNDRLNDIIAFFGDSKTSTFVADIQDPEAAEKSEEITGRNIFEDAQTAANKARHALTPTDVQCLLLEHIRALSVSHIPQYKHLIRLDTNKEPALVQNRLEHKMEPDEVKAFLEMCPDLQGSIVPYLRLYRVDYDKFGKIIGDEKEFRIPNFILDNDVTQIMEGNRGRVPGAGIKSFTWSLDGIQPAEVDNNISATLDMYFQSVADFFQGSMQAGGKRTSFLDLVISSPGSSAQSLADAKPKGDDPKAKAPKSKSCLDQHLTRDYTGANYRIKVVAGWSAPDGLEDIYVQLGKERAEALGRAIAKSKKVLFLQQARHELDFNQDGSLSLSIKYQASLSGMLTGRTSNIFATSSESIKKDIAAKEAEVEELGDRAAKSKGGQRAVEAALNELKRLRGEDKLIKYRKLLRGLFASKKIYNLAIDKKEFALPQWAQLTGKQRARRAMRKQAVALEVTTGGGPENTVVLDSVAKAIHTQGSTADAASATSTALIPKYDLLAKDPGAITTISYFYLGDLLDNVLEQIKANQDGQPLDFQFFLSEVEMIDPLQAMKIKNMDDILNSGQSLSSMAFLDALAASDPAAFSKTMGVTQLMNIGDIPISLDAFQIWFKDKVIKKDLDNYYFLHFVKDLCADLISGALKSKCFGPDVQFIQRFDAQPISLRKGFEAVPLVPGGLMPVTGMTGLSTLIQASDEITSPKKLTLGVVLFSTDSRPKDLTGDYATDIQQGVYHHYLGSPCGLVKSIKFNREEQPMLREAKIQKKGALGAEQLRELYSATLELYGNTLYKNGNFVYINPMLMGATQKQLTTLGLHGYYRITKVESKISEAGFDVSIKALLEGTEFCDTKLMAPETYGAIRPEEEIWYPPGSTGGGASGGGGGGGSREDPGHGLVTMLDRFAKDVGN